MGMPYEYWRELHIQAEKEDAVDLYHEIASLRARVSFYEDRIKQLNYFMESMNGN